MPTLDTTTDHAPHRQAGAATPTGRVRRGPYVRFGKRIIDLLFATSFLIISLPVMLVIAILIRITMGQGVIFRQTRVGRHGEDFTMYKFRTMHGSRRLEALSFDGMDRRLTHKTIDDPRHTRLGRMMRRTSIDELPQLLNVVRGNMSVVGPRPEISDLVDRRGYRAHIRHAVRPGLTGPWQVQGRDRMIHEGFALDERYVTSDISLMTDVVLLAQTAASMRRNSGS